MFVGCIAKYVGKDLVGTVSNSREENVRERESARAGKRREEWPTVRLRPARGGSGGGDKNEITDKGGKILDDGDVLLHRS